jgi:succinate-semialdehyde dehydrogenase/glutarate-semialdehyde dehydrogenase
MISDNERTATPLALAGLQTGEESPHYDLFIDGEWTGGTGDARFAVIDPSTAAPITTVADATVEDAVHAVDAASAALPGWAMTSPRQRSEVLRACYEVITAAAEDLAYLISLENGKAIPDSRAEVAYAAEFFRWYSEEAVRNVGSVSVAPSGQNRILVQHQPIGVCVLVTPWNFPAAMATRKLAPALAAGCTAVLKPASQTPLSAYAIAALMTAAGVPPGVINVIATSRSGPTVSSMLHDPRVRLLSFTGSTEVGRVLLREASDQVLKCAMELGGNAPLIVLDDADLPVAVEGAMIAKMRNGGQACTAANRIYAHKSIHDEFVSALGERMAALTVGPGTDPSTQCGPLIDAAAVRKVHELVGDARGRGARLVVGDGPLSVPGYFYAPTVIADVKPESAIASSEIFGPVAAVMPFERDEEVVGYANDTEYGLSAYVFSRDVGRALRLAERLESGMVAINRGLVSDPAAPFGGVKQSGLGREGGVEGMREFTEAKYIAVEW